MKESIITVAAFLNAVMPEGNAKKSVAQTLASAGTFFAKNENATTADFVAALEKARKLAEDNRKQRAERRDNATANAFEALAALA